MSRHKTKFKKWNITFYRDPVEEETQIRAKTADEAVKMLYSIVPDATIWKVWELKGVEDEKSTIR